MLSAHLSRSLVSFPSSLYSSDSFNLSHLKTNHHIDAIYVYYISQNPECQFPFQKSNKRIGETNVLCFAVASKELRYVERRELCDSDCEELNEKIAVLSALITDSRAAKENNITYYVPCGDPNNEAFMRLGRYVTVEDVVMNVDTVFGSITVGRERIGLGDVVDIDILY